VQSLSGLRTRFQLILFNPIGRVKIWEAKASQSSRFQLILFNPIGRVFLFVVGIFSSFFVSN